MRRRLRSRRGVAIMAGVALAVFVGRALWANGLFSSVPTGFVGSCKTVASVPGVEDMEAAGGPVFVAVASARENPDWVRPQAMPVAVPMINRIAPDRQAVSISIGNSRRQSKRR